MMLKIKVKYTILFFFFALAQVSQAESWKFIVIGDTHIPSSDTLLEMIPFIEDENPDLIIVPGDLVDGGLKCTANELLTQLITWQSAFEPLLQKGIKIYPIRGNHEDDAKNNIEVWNQVFSGDWQLPQNGPSGEAGLTYSFSNKNAKFIGLDNYINIHKINQEWLDGELSKAEEPHIFVFAHEPAFKVFHTDCLDDSLSARNEFWQSLSKNKVKAYFCGHDHFYNVIKIDDGDGKTDNDIYQFLVGSGGGWLMPKHNLNGENSMYQLEELIHKIEHGYAIIEVSGETNDDLNVSVTWKGRSFNEESGQYIYTPIDEVISYSVPNESSIIKDFNSSNICISPNPAIDYINVDFAKLTKSSRFDKFETIKIYNTFGEILITDIQSLGEVGHLKRIDISQLPPGIYNLSFGEYIEKFLIVR